VEEDFSKNNTKISPVINKHKPKSTVMEEDNQENQLLHLETLLLINSKDGLTLKMKPTISKILLPNLLRENLLILFQLKFLSRFKIWILEKNTKISNLR
jgi:hypothetical protein